MRCRYSSSNLPSAILACLLLGAAASGQALDNPDFKALPRPINYATSLAPANGAKAVIVYGKEAPWTQKAAEAVQKAILDWSGVKLELADDRTVTSDDTWLLTDAYRKTPLIVLGNAWENRVMHALGTRYLLQSNRTWPGGDRFLIRTVFEPFEADVNHIVLEASNRAGLDGAVAKLAELLATFPKEGASIPRLRVVAGVKDKWSAESGWWKMPPDFPKDLSRSVAEIALAHKGEPVTAGDDFSKAGLGADIYYYMLGGIAERPPNVRPTFNLDPGTIRAMAAMYLLGYRAAGGRTHRPSDHYGAMNSIIGARCFMQAGVLTEREVNEFENAFTLSAAYPNEYFYDRIASATGMVNASGGRHFMACLLLSLHTQDYVLHHCRLDERTRKEVQRRYDGARKCAAEYVRSFRNNDDGSCLGEDTMLQLYAVLYEGLREHIRTGTLRQMADFYVMTSDNLYVPGEWPFYGCYAGLGGFACGPGGIMTHMVGRGIIDAAAFYYDDPQYRWLAKNWIGNKWMVPAQVMNMHLDYEGPMTKPTLHNGVRALPYDERMYRVIADRGLLTRMQTEARLPPDPVDKAIDRVAFRDGLDPDDAYLFLAASQNHSLAYPAQNNSIARYTDLSDLWLFANTMSASTWSRSVVSISNGKSYVPRVACLQEALANLGEVSTVSSLERDIAGTDWTRTIVHWKGHYFAVLDRMQALQEDDFAFVCRWRSFNPASLHQGIWTAVADSGNVLRIQSTDGLFQTAEHWAIDGSAAPYVLQQYKQARLRKGQIESYQNLMYVSGAKRPDEFEARRAGAAAMMVKGKTAAGDHLALIGTRGGPFPIGDFDTDAEVYDVTGNLLHLASVTSLKASVNGAMQEVFESQRPVNLLVNCESGQAELEIPGQAPVQVRVGSAAFRPYPGTPRAEARTTNRETVTLAAAGTLPKPAAALEKLWNTCPAPAPTAQPAARDVQAFEARKASDALERPLRRLTRFAVTSTPPSAPPRNTKYIWQDTANLEVTITLPEATSVDCLRLVSITKPVSMYGIGSQGWGTPHYKADDFQFSLVLSDDGFQKDIRRIDKPNVVYEETSECYVGHFSKFRLPTWRVTVDGKARQIKLLPRATTKERAALHLKNIEVYEAQRVDELAVQALAADIDGDGANELVLGTSQCQLAAYNSDGKRLWLKDTFPGAIHLLAAGDLDDDGKSETLAYLSTEKLRRINGDGTERPPADITEAQLKYNDQRAGGGNITTIGLWGRGNAKSREGEAPAEPSRHVVLWAEGMFRVLPDGTTILESGKIQHPQGVARLANMYPNEPEALVTANRYGIHVWSSRSDAKGNYIHLGQKPMTGPDSGETRGLGYVQPVDVPGFKGVVAAIEGGVWCFPISAFLPKSKEEGWRFNTGGVPAVAALADDLNGDGVPEVLLGRVDGFVNVFRLADGASVGLLSTGQPILGMAMLKGRDGKPCLAVGTKFAVHLFGSDFKPVGRHSIPAVAFAGPGGRERDRVFIVGADGGVTVLVLAAVSRK